MKPYSHNIQLSLFLFFVILLLLSVATLHASQSTITESEGYACMGDDKSRKQTEQAAMADAKRKAESMERTKRRDNRNYDRVLYLNIRGQIQERSVKTGETEYDDKEI